MRKQNQKINVVFDGQLHQIKSNTLIASVVSLSNILQEINQELDPSHPLDIKIEALAPGSFDIHFVIEKFSQLKSLLGNKLEEISKILDIIIAVFTIKKHLGGKKAKEIKPDKDDKNKIIIKNNYGKVIVCDKIHYDISQKQSISDSISDNFSALTEETAIDSFSLRIDKKPQLKIEQNFFATLAQRQEIEDSQKEKEILLNDQTLYIQKIVFLEHCKWDFIYQGNKISANIIDKSFFDDIDKGEAFSKGDILICDLSILQVYDETVNTYVNKFYTIKKIINHTKRKKQERLI